MGAQTIHGSAVLVGARAVLIRGPSGSGKSRLVMALLEAAQCGLLSFARLVGDDRLQLESAHGRLLVRPAAELAGLIEVHGLGIRRLPYEPVAAVGWVVDLAAADAERLPAAERRATTVEGVRLARLPVAPAADPTLLLLALLNSAAA
jgi:serine kinase of HPr protein (carbohydrate metabolism regulator)